MTKIIAVVNLVIIIVVAIIFVESCGKNELDDEKIAKHYCSSCHLFPEASLLSNSTWQKSILPAMGGKLGIRYFMGEPQEASQSVLSPTKNIASVTPVIISIGDWRKIMEYYERNAPEQDLPQDRPAINNFTNRFNTETLTTDNKSFSVTFLKIDTANKLIYAADAADTSLYMYNSKLQQIASFKTNGIVVDMDVVHADTTMERSGVLTNIGIMNPNDLSTGSADSFHISKAGKLDYLQQVLQHMPRPVQTTITDLDKDGRNDYLVGGFGNTSGALYWMKNNGDNTFQRNIIRALPGAIKAYVDDYNHDGLPDILALMAQAQEGVYLFTNKGNGNFDTKALLQFPPVYGSSSFEYIDMNNDGYKDILYTCGDNADYSAHDLKKYHGVYIFLNDGKDNFSQKYFFPIHGCYKAIAKDFDNDGDLDIATISFFPDTRNQPQESFVYLENEGTGVKDHFQFQPSGIHEFNEGNWLTMDAGDIDGDGDEDIILGNFRPPSHDISATVNTNKTAFLLLRNNTKK